MGKLCKSKLGKMGKSVLPQPVIILGTPCHIIICNAFAFTGRGLPEYTRLPRVSLRLPWAKRSLGFQPVVPDDPHN